MIDRLAIRCNSPSQNVSNLSGGNQQKVALAKWLLSGAKVLVLDEPTRGVDVGARQEIYGIIRELAAEGVSIVIVSSDLPGDPQHLRAGHHHARGQDHGDARRIGAERGESHVLRDRRVTGGGQWRP